MRRLWSGAGGGRPLVVGLSLACVIHSGCPTGTAVLIEKSLDLCLYVSQNLSGALASVHLIPVTTAGGRVVGVVLLVPVASFSFEPKPSCSISQALCADSSSISMSVSAISIVSVWSSVAQGAAAYRLEWRERSPPSAPRLEHPLFGHERRDLQV